MPANPEIASVATPPPGADLDEFLRALKGSGNPTPPAQQADQPGSSLSNTHQGQSAPSHENRAIHFANRSDGEQSELPSSGNGKEGAAGSYPNESDQSPVDDLVAAHPQRQNGPAEKTISTYGETPVKFPSTSAAALGVTGRNVGDLASRPTRVEFHS